MKRIIFGAGLLGTVAALFLTIAPAQAEAQPPYCQTLMNKNATTGGFSVAARTNIARRRLIEDCTRPRRARLVNGKAIPPANAPLRVRRAIRWANHITDKPYVWGGGHGSFFDRGYDCSGAVSFALRGGKFVDRPKNSTGFYGWGRPGVGRWITIYTNPGHMYAVIAGLRFDTSGTGGNGPRWHADHRSSSGFQARRPGGRF